MFVAIWLVLVMVVLAASAYVAVQKGVSEGGFAAGMAIAGILVMLVTLIAYPATRSRGR
jgi:hypothetical protein